MRWTPNFLAALSLLPAVVVGADTATVRLADGFEVPVGRDGTKRFYVARGVRANGHLGEDWNGEGGGDTDLGDPVYATAHGVVVFAEDYKLGWGNVVILRHAYMEGDRVQYVDSLYGHLHEILVANGQKVTRGQKIGSIGNNRGQYDAHLHFEMRKNLNVGMFRNSFPRDLSVYWEPSVFIAARRVLPSRGQLAAVPINTFPAQPPPVLIGTHESTPQVPFGRASTFSGQGAAKPGVRGSRTFTIDRYGDIREFPK